MLDKELAIMMKCLSLQNSAVCKVGISFLYNSMEYLLYKNDIPTLHTAEFQRGRVGDKNSDYYFILQHRFCAQLFVELATFE